MNSWALANRTLRERVRGPPEAAPATGPSPCIPEGTLAGAGRPVGAAAEFKPQRPARESGRVSPPLFRSREARRGQEGGQRTEVSGQQVQRPAALSLRRSELGPHGSGRAARAAPPGAAPRSAPRARRSILQAHAGVQDEDGGPARPAAVPGADRAGGGHGCCWARVQAGGSPAPLHRSPTAARWVWLPLSPAAAPSEVRAAGRLPRKFQPPGLRKKPSAAAARTPARPAPTRPPRRCAALLREAGVRMRAGGRPLPRTPPPRGGAQALRLWTWAEQSPAAAGGQRWG